MKFTMTRDPQTNTLHFKGELTDAEQYDAMQGVVGRGAVMGMEQAGAPPHYYLGVLAMLYRRLAEREADRSAAEELAATLTRAEDAATP